MAFPWLALVTAAASDSSQRADERDAVMKAGHRAQSDILRTRARELGGSPYGLMAQDFETQLGDIRRNASDQRNNNIGALLQSYLRQEMSEPDKSSTIGGSDIPSVSDLGAGNQRGLDMVDGLFSGESSKLYEDDPWGSGTF